MDMEFENSEGKKAKKGLSRIDGNKLISVVYDPSILRQAYGFWSKKLVFFNPGDSIVLLRDISVSDIRECINRTLEEKLEDAVFKRLSSVSRSLLLHYFSLNDLPNFQGAEFRVGGHMGRSVQVEKVLDFIKATFPNDEVSQKTMLAQQICAAYRSGKSPVAPLHMGADNLTALTHPGLGQILRSEISAISLIEALASISRYNTSWQKNKDEIRRISIIESNQNSIAALEKFGINVAGVSQAWIVSLVASVRLLLAVLTRDELILLPADFFGMALSIRALRPDFFDSVEKRYHFWISILLSSSTIQSLEDLPSNFHQWADGIPQQVYANTVLLPALKKHQEQHGLATWPIGGLNRSKSSSNRASKTWTPDWVESEGFGKDWVAFAKLAFHSSSAGLSAKREELKFLYGWVRECGIQSPADITVLHLVNPGNPNQKGTFSDYLDRTQNKPYTGWIRTSALMRRICNQIKVNQGCGFDIKINPFELVPVPFSPGSNNKTPRRRLPTNIHEAMIETLLEPDASGNPTYRFVRDVLAWDWYEHIETNDRKAEMIWCPSRAACLGLLLILPFRSKQARWLDRGLMDTHLWDVNTWQWLPNVHALASFKYPDGFSHVERSGRNTGVLQPISNPLNESEQLGIYVNTNKTQMWDPSNRTGYEVPWPDRSALISDLLKLKETLRWIDRPYVILRQQISWQEKFNPNPIPVGFMDSSYDRELIDDRYAGHLPLFTPVFADLSSDYYRNDDGDALIHLPVHRDRLLKLFNALACEVEKRLKDQGHKVTLTEKSNRSTAFEGRVCIFDLHSLRVAGISRLIEIGIPVHIIQEYIVGHATMVMTYHYIKLERDYLEKCLLSANPPDEGDLLGDWDNLRPELAKKGSLWVLHPRYSNNRPEELLDIYTGWKLVPGGICPLGGHGCEDGQPLETDNPFSDGGKDSERQFGPVRGGCGNCRYFCTGPAFLIQQAQVSNEIMLDMRALGKQRHALYQKLAELNRSDVPGIDQAKIRKIELNRLSLKDQIDDIDVRLETQILEWVNRYQMFQESQKLIAKWREFIDSNGNKNNNKQPVTLFSGIDAEELQTNLQVRLSKAGDFTLVRSILEGAKLRGGLAKASSIAKKQMAEFVDRILRAQNSRHLLLDIRDDEMRVEAAFHMATFASHLVGDQAIEKALENGESLPLSVEQKESWLAWTDKIVSTTAKPSEDGLFMPIISEFSTPRTEMCDE